MLVPACRERGVSRAGVIGSQGRGSIRLCPPMLPRFPDAGGAAYRGQSGAPLLASSSSPEFRVEAQLDLDPRMSPHLHLRAFTGRPAAIGAAHRRPRDQHGLAGRALAIPALTLAESYATGEAYQIHRRLPPRRRAVLGPDLADAVERTLLLLEDTGLTGSRTSRRRAARPVRRLRPPRRARDRGLAGRRLRDGRRGAADPVMAARPSSPAPCSPPPAGALFLVRDRLPWPPLEAAFANGRDTPWQRLPGRGGLIEIDGDGERDAGPRGGRLRRRSSRPSTGAWPSASPCPASWPRRCWPMASAASPTLTHTVRLDLAIPGLAVPNLRAAVLDLAAVASRERARLPAADRPRRAEPRSCSRPTSRCAARASWRPAPTAPPRDAITIPLKQPGGGTDRVASRSRPSPPLDVLIDTGAAGVLALSEAAARNAGLTRPRPPVTSAHSVSLGGLSLDRRVTARTVRVGELNAARRRRCRSTRRPPTRRRRPACWARDSSASSAWRWTSAGRRLLPRSAPADDRRTESRNRAAETIVRPPYSLRESPMKSALSVAAAATAALIAWPPARRRTRPQPRRSGHQQRRGEHRPGRHLRRRRARPRPPPWARSPPTPSSPGRRPATCTKSRPARSPQKKGQSAGVKAFAKMMVTDHTAMSKRAEPAVSRRPASPPTGLDERRKGMIDNLNAASAGRLRRAPTSASRKPPTRRR